MGIDFSAFSSEVQAKIKKALADDGKISKKELQKMGIKKDVQKAIINELAGNPDMIGDGFTRIKVGDMNITFYDKPTDGSVDMPEDTIAAYKKEYPDADIAGASLYKGTVFLRDSQGKLAKDKDGNPIVIGKTEKPEVKSSFAEWYKNNNKNFDLETLKAMEELDNRITEMDFDPDEYEIQQIHDKAMQKSYFSIDRAVGLNKARLMEMYNTISKGKFSEAASLMYQYFEDECAGFDEEILFKIKNGLEILSGAKWAGPALYSILSNVAEKGDNIVGRDENGIGYLERLVVGMDNADTALGDFVFSTEGLITMGAIAGGEALIANTAKTFAPYIGAAIHSYFGAEGASLVGEGAAKVATGKTLDEVAEGGQMVGYGLPLAITLIKPGVAMIKGIKFGNKTAKSIEKSLPPELQAYLKGLKNQGIDYNLKIENNNLVIETNKDAAKGFVDVIKSIQEKEANALIAELKNTTEANKRQAIKQRLASYGYQVFEIRVNGRVETIVYSSEGKLVGDKPGATKTEITPDGTEIRINVNDEKLEFRPDNTFVKYDKDGNIIKTDIWKDINGTKMTLTEAEYDWGSDHMGRRTIEPNVLEELNKFIDENKDNIGFQKQREIINRVSSQVVGFETISEYGKRIIYGKNAGGQTVKSTVIEGELVTDSYFDGLKVVDQTFVNGKLIGSSVTIPSEKKVYLDAKGKAITEKVFNNAVNKAKQSKPTKTAYSHETNNTQTTKKNSYIAPETKNGEMTTGSHVMANSSLKSSDYLSNANRLLHPKNYELAKMLSDCGIQLEIGVDGTFHAEIPYPSDSLKDINPKTNMLKELWRDYGRYNDEIIFNVSFNKNNKCIRIYGKLENADMYEYKANDPFLGPINQDHARAFDIMSALVRKITDGEKLNMRAGLNDFLAFCKRSADIQARRNLEDAANSIINTYNITNLYYKEIESIVNMHLQSEDYSTDEISEIVRLVAKERDFRLLQMTDRTPKQQEIFERSFNVQKQKGTNPDDNAEVEVVLSENYFNDEGVNVSIVSDTYAQLVENPLFISLENNSKNRRIQIDTGIYQIQREPSGDFLGNKMKREEPIIVDGTAKFRLAGTVELDLNSPAIKNILDGLYPGEEVNVGRSALITIENAPKVVSKNHLTIKKLADNTYEVTDVSKNGTEINLAHNGVVEVLSCDDKEPSGIIDIDEQRRLEEERQRFEQQRRDEEEALGNAAMQQELNDEFYNSSDNPESYCPDDIIDL